MRALVLGGRGFIGRHAVRALARRGHGVAVGSRRRAAGLVEAHLEALGGSRAWLPLLRDVDVVVNAVGILRERPGESYARIHHRAPAALAEACARLGVRLIHISALGLRDGARSRFITSKLAGERAVAASGADYCIVRPSLLDGEGGFGALWFRRVARWPVHFLPTDARGRIDALDVAELGEALAALCEKHNLREWRNVELGGGAPRSLGDYLAALRPAALSSARRVAVPASLARLASHLCDLLHFTPLSFGHIELMRHDNIPHPNRLAELLGRAPAPICAPEVRKTSDAYGWGAVLRNVLPFLSLLAAAPLVYRCSPAAPWLLSPLIGLFAYRITLVMHDCIHRSLFSSARLNERVGTLLGGITGIDFRSFSREHLLHHRLHGRPGDPQGFHYLALGHTTPAGFAWHLLRPLLGWNVRYALAESIVRPRNLAAAVKSGDIVLVLAMQCGVLAIATGGGAHLELAALPLVSAASFGLFFSQLRGIAEHTPAGRVRSHAPHWLDQWLLYDLNFNYHREHHLYPHVPSRDLPSLRRRLAKPAPLATSMLRTIWSLASNRR